MTAAQSSPEEQPSAARLDRVSKLFGNFAVLRQLSAEFLPGRCYVLLGENGAGKSTLLRLLAGLIRPTHGTIRLFGGLDPSEARARVGYMSHAPMLYDELTALENLRYFAALYPGRPSLEAHDLLGRVGLDPELDRPLGQYSQGMRQRTSLARVLLGSPELLLLDEPFSNMDIDSARQMVVLLSRLRQSNRALLLTTHQRELAAPLADFYLTLHAGRLASLESANSCIYPPLPADGATTAPSVCGQSPESARMETGSSPTR